MIAATEWLYGASQWIVFPVSVAALLTSAWLGQQAGLRSAARGRDDRSGAIGTLQGTALGLVTLMISFTFSVAVSRYDTRKAFVLEEALALSTAQSRAEMLPRPQADAAAGILDDYLKVRLTVEDRGPGAQRQIAAQSMELQRRLWDQAVAVAALDSRSIPNGLFIQAVNDLEDMVEKRLTADRSHVPEAVFLLLYLLAAAALGLNGYKAGLGGGRPAAASIVTSLLLAIVILQIQDLDRPRSGLITVSQQPLHNLTGDVK